MTTRETIAEFVRTDIFLGLAKAFRIIFGGLALLAAIDLRVRKLLEEDFVIAGGVLRELHVWNNHVLLVGLCVTFAYLIHVFIRSAEEQRQKDCPCHQSNSPTITKRAV